MKSENIVHGPVLQTPSGLVYSITLLSGHIVTNPTGFGTDVELISQIYESNKEKESKQQPILILTSQANKLFEAEDLDNRIIEAARLLYQDYVEDKELTIFTSLDSEDFYEER